MALAQHCVLSIPDSVAEDAARVVVYQQNSSTPASIWSDNARAYPLSGGIITVLPGQAYVTFFCDELVDVEIQDSAYTPLYIFRGLNLVRGEPAYDGGTENFKLSQLEARVLRGGPDYNPTPISTAPAGVLSLPGDYEAFTISVEGVDIDTVISLSTTGRFLTLYFTGTCRLYNSTTGNLALKEDLLTVDGTVLVLQAFGGRWRELSRCETTPDQDEPVAITVNDEFVLPYNVEAFHVVSNATPTTDLRNIYLHDSSYELPHGRILHLRTYTGEIAYLNSQGNLRLQGDFTAPQGAVLSLVAIGNLWHEIGRSVAGNDIQQQVSIPEAVSQSVTLTSTTRVVLLKSSGDAQNKAPPVWFMTGGNDGDEITIMVSPTAISPDETWLTHRVPIEDQAIAANGYFRLTTKYFGMVPGDCLKVVRLTDSSGYYYWQEASRSMTDIEPLLEIKDIAEYSLEIWRNRHVVKNSTASNKKKINYLSPDWLPIGSIIAIRAESRKFKLTSKGLDGVNAEPNIVVKSNEYEVEPNTDAGNKNAYFMKVSDPADSSPNIENTEAEQAAGDPVSATRDWIQIKHPKVD